MQYLVCLKFIIRLFIVLGFAKLQRICIFRALSIHGVIPRGKYIYA